MNHYSDVCNWLYEMARARPGENIETELNGVSVLLLQSRSAADWVLRRNSTNYIKNMVWFRQALGASRFSENGEAWRLRKDLSQRYFNKFDRQRIFQLATRYAGIAVHSLMSASAQGRETLDDEIFRELAVSVLMEGFLGASLQDSGIDVKGLADLVECGSAHSFVPAGQVGALYGSNLARLPKLRRQVMAGFCPFREGTLGGGALLNGLLAADRDPTTDVVFEHELLTFFAAGSETTAATMGWLCYLLAANPQVQERLRETLRGFELDCHWRAVSEIPLLRRFISEALRLYPSTPLIARLAMAADYVEGIAISAGQNVLVSLIGVQNDDGAGRRWEMNLDSDDQERDSFAFSLGPRACGGKQFALLEMAAFLFIFLKSARFELTSDVAPSFYWKSQMVRKGGHPVRLIEL